MWLLHQLAVAEGAGKSVNMLMFYQRNKFSKNCFFNAIYLWVDTQDSGLRLLFCESWGRQVLIFISGLSSCGHLLLFLPAWNPVCDPGSLVTKIVCPGDTICESCFSSSLLGGVLMETRVPGGPHIKTREFVALGFQTNITHFLCCLRDRGHGALSPEDLGPLLLSPCTSPPPRPAAKSKRQSRRRCCIPSRGQLVAATEGSVATQVKIWKLLLPLQSCSEFLLLVCIHGVFFIKSLISWEESCISQLFFLFLTCSYWVFLTMGGR